ncbi:hypothetical protein ACVK00_006213 [Burkholderia sp. PvR073]
METMQAASPVIRRDGRSNWSERAALAALLEKDQTAA